MRKMSNKEEYKMLNFFGFIPFLVTILNLLILGIGLYALFLLIKALKIYIEKNS